MDPVPLVAVSHQLIQAVRPHGFSEDPGRTAFRRSILFLPVLWTLIDKTDISARQVHCGPDGLHNIARHWLHFIGASKYVPCQSGSVPTSRPRWVMLFSLAFLVDWVGFLVWTTFVLLRCKGKDVKTGEFLGAGFVAILTCSYLLCVRAWSWSAILTWVWTRRRTRCCSGARFVRCAVVPLSCSDAAC